MPFHQTCLSTLALEQQAARPPLSVTYGSGFLFPEAVTRVLLQEGENRPCVPGRVGRKLKKRRKEALAKGTSWEAGCMDSRATDKLRGETPGRRWPSRGPGLSLCGPCPAPAGAATSIQGGEALPGEAPKAGPSPQHLPPGVSLKVPPQAPGPPPVASSPASLSLPEQPRSVRHLLPVNCGNNDLQNWAEVILSSLVVKSDAEVISPQRQLSASFIDELTSCDQNMVTIFTVSHLTGVVLKFLARCKL